jgi:hypothetical protein
MKRILLVTGVLALVAMGAVILELPLQPAAQGEGPKPTLVPIEALTPAPTPPDQREVAILTLVTESDPEGQIELVALEQARILRSYAPNVLNRTGPWTVELVGERGLRYGVQDPRWRELFPVDGDEPFQNEWAPNVVWELVVPLYLFDEDLNVHAITLYDETGNLIFETEVDRENWR